MRLRSHPPGNWPWWFSLRFPATVFRAARLAPWCAARSILRRLRAKFSRPPRAGPFFVPSSLQDSFRGVKLFLNAGLLAAETANLKAQAVRRLEGSQFKNI